MFLIVEAGDVRCALPLGAVVEVMRPLPLKHLAQAPPGVRGVALIRGEASPVLDLSELLDKTRTSPRRFVSLHVGNRSCALAVDSVIGIEAIDRETWQSLPPLLKNNRYAQALSVLDRDLVLLLEAGRILPLLESLPADLA